MGVRDMGATKDGCGLSPLGTLTLAMLNERPMHPYEMFQLLLSRHEDRIAKVSAGSLYRTIERLTDDGLARVVGTASSGNRPERTTYAITDQGHDTLVRRVREMLSAPPREYPAFVLALSEAHNVDRAHAASDLRDHLEALDDELAELTAVADIAREKGTLEIYYVGADYLRHMLTAQRCWVAHFLTRIEKDDIPWP